MKTLEPQVEDEWDEYVRSHDGSLIYQSLVWRDLLVDLLGARPDYVVVRRQERLTGVLPMMWRDSPDGAILNSLPYFGSNGGILASDESSHAALLAAWNDRALDPGTAAATMVCNPFIAGTEDDVCHTHVDSRWSHATPLRKDVDPLTLAESSAARNVRKAARSDVEVERDASALVELAVLHREHMQALGGRAKDDAFFELLPGALEPGDEYDVYEARVGGELAAGLLVLYFGQTVEYYLPAIASRFRELQPLAPLLREAMLEAAARGFTRWNWGGSWTSQDGVARFKAKWGGLPSRYAYYTQVNNEALRQRSPEALLDQGGHFFVVPFSSLTH